uniref:hypothetical protein n=1 Tax=Amorphus coralli TaxID=340680 RepID=UPI001AEC3A46
KAAVAGSAAVSDVYIDPSPQNCQRQQSEKIHTDREKESCLPVTRTFGSALSNWFNWVFRRDKRA